MYQDIRPSGMLRSVDWWSVTDVSRQPIRPTFKGQAVQEECWEISQANQRAKPKSTSLGLFSQTCF